MKMLKSHKGLSLIEVTIMLLVLMLLTSVLAPSIFDFVKDAARVKVKEDCEAIALSVARFVRDNGYCFKESGGAICSKNNRVDLLYSDGAWPQTLASAGTTGATINSNYFEDATMNWCDTSTVTPSPAGALADCVASTQTGALQDHLVTNAPGYPLPNGAIFQNPLPLFATGWRGAYLSSPIGHDPWGSKYMVNSAFLTTTDSDGLVVTACDSIDDGCNYDTICISAGENGIVETPFAASGGGTQRTGDDFITVISGGIR